MDNIQSILDDIRVDEVPSSTVTTWMINLLDGVIEVAILIALYFLLPRESMYSLLSLNPAMKYIFTLIVIFAYRLICLLTLGRTISMVICGTKYLNGNLLPLTTKEKFSAVFLTRGAAIKSYKA